MVSRISASCRAKATRISSGCASHSFVLPSMSVNRKVTVPVGNRESVRGVGGIALGAEFTRGKTHSAGHVLLVQPGPPASAESADRFARSLLGGRRDRLLVGPTQLFRSVALAEAAKARIGGSPRSRVRIPGALHRFEQADVYARTGSEGRGRDDQLGLAGSLRKSPLGAGFLLHGASSHRLGAGACWLDFRPIRQLLPAAAPPNTSFRPLPSFRNWAGFRPRMQTTPPSGT